MNIDLEVNSSPDKVVERLKETGVVRLKNFAENCDDIKGELTAVYDKIEPNYQFGKAIRTDHNTWDTSKTPTTNSFFRGSGWMYEIYEKYQGDNPHNFQRDLFSSHDFISHQGIGPQGWSHFDKIQRLKFFLYVTDVNENSGPLRCAPGSHHIVRALRAKEADPSSPTRWRFGRYYCDPGYLSPGDWSEGAINGSQNHYPEIEYKMQDVTGSAGTLIVFDSNVIHSGGQVKDGEERIVARAHSW